MNAFADAAAVLAADPNLGADAAFTPVVGSPVTLRVVLSRLEDPLGGASPGASASGWQAMIPAASLAAPPARGDVLAVGTRTFKVESAELDAADAAWRVVLLKTGSWD